MKNKNYLKFIHILSVICLILTISWCFIEISDLKKENEDTLKELTALQQEKREMIKDYRKLADLFNQTTVKLEHEQEVAGLREKYETELEYYAEDLSPKEVVEGFIEADMAGARIGGEIAEEAPNIRKYIAYNAHMGSPSPDFAMVIKKYEILDEYSSEKNGNSHYYVKVKYFCKEGTASGSMGISDEVKKGAFVIVPCNPFFKEICPLCFQQSTEISSVRVFDFQEETEIITFELIKDKGLWKLNSPSICPRISEQTFQKELENSSK